MSIQQWPEGERPRERLLSQGAAHLTDAELIAVLLGNGTVGQDAVGLARSLLSKAGGVSRLLADPQNVPRVVGVGPAKRARLIATLELARRALAERLLDLPALANPRESAAYLSARLRHLPYEVFVCLFLDNRNRVLACDELFRGTVDGASVYPREVVRACLKHNASAVIFAHNHPSGVAEPSEADRDITEVLGQALALIDVRVLDHLIVGEGEPVSMALRGLL
ncbi:DNA repair protein RadC [Luteibacter rhizovicinus]|uniref:DNA repair protein RadC n=1 Tax=Luteibacter rhizovicinus TaxID=242606 RepID=A0A4R3YK87_9GAMM|nr:DNA repair protein RadC [Luteibacter rhizovicinus]TCV92676.1 DNA repair protein RadC [Luteibacter rhizovicinus]